MPIFQKNGKVKQVQRDPFINNSFYLILSKGISISSGFFFWLLAARFYSIEDVGLATGLISSLALIMLFSNLGFDFALIRFIAIDDKNKIFNTCLTITSLTSFVVGTFYILISYLTSLIPNYIFKMEYIIVFLIIVILNSMTLIIGNGLIALKKAKLFFIQNIIIAMRALFLFFFVSWGYIGIFMASGLVYLPASLFVFFYLKNLLQFNLKIDTDFVKKSFKFSCGNYIASILLIAPSLILPLMVLSLLGEAEAAKFYIAFTIGNVVLIIPDSLSTSLLVEGSYGGNLKNIIIKAIITCYFLLIPALLTTHFFGDFFLGLFGEEYIIAFNFLQLIVVSSIFVTPYLLLIPALNVKMEVNSIIKLNFVRFIMIMILSYVAMSRIGLLGVGYAWIFTHILLIIPIAAMIWKNRCRFDDNY